jgi:hypothetical protein
VFHKRRTVPLAFIVTASAIVLCGSVISVASAGEPAAPLPSPSPTPRGLIAHASIATLFLSQSSVGPGLQPVEGPSFAAGAPAAPVSPYDPFSGAPLVPGNVGQNQIALELGYQTNATKFGVTLDAESLLGDRTNEAYWSEPLLDVDNPHTGSPAMGFSIKIPTHPGTDDYDSTRAGISQAHVSLDHDRYVVRAGSLDLKQSLGFVFAPAPTANALPTLLPKTTESLNPNDGGLDAWQPSPSTLPMRGFDLVTAAGSVTIEATDAALPSLPGTPARFTSLSAGSFDDAGHGAMFQIIHAHTGGDPIGTTTGFGAQTQIVESDQGLFALSTLHGQRQTIAGARVAEPLGLGLDATLEYAHSSYQADDLGEPSTVGGSWDHVSLAHALGPATVTANYYRFEPTFATMILPYGIPENVWSVAYSWPGPWLKSNFQLVDTSAVGVNRQGPSLSYALDSKSLTAFVSYASFRQITPFTTANFRQLGFIDGFFLVQTDPSQATTGTYKRAVAYLGKTFAFGTIGFDVVDDGLYRPSAVGKPFDAVAFDAPEYVASWSRTIGERTALAAGAGYFGEHGSWADGAATNVDIGMHEYYAGAQVQEQSGRVLMVTVRKSIFRGAPYFGALHALQYGSPDFNATTILVEQRIRV